MEIRRAIPADYPGIYQLAEASYIENLAPADRQQGFLSVRFSLQSITTMASGLGIIVAREGDRVVGFVGATASDAGHHPPLVKSMIQKFDRIQVAERPLNDYRLFIYGPVCIDAAYRGRGLLRQLYRHLKAELSSAYDLGVALVADNNPHSLNAHIAGLGMSPAGRFGHEQHTYQILVFPVEAG